MPVENIIDFTSAAESLERLSGLSDGWNGYGAPAPAPVSIRCADAFLLVCRGQNFFPTRIAASVIGGVGITYRLGTRKGYIEFYNDGSVALLLADDATQQLQTRSVAQNDEDFGAAIGEVRAFVDGRHPG